MSALDFTARALALRAAAHVPLTFVDFSQVPLPPTVARIETSGHSEPGWGGGTYIADALADAALQAAHPGAVFAGRGGRLFRLIAGERGFVTPEQFGCPPSAPGVNQQRFIQAAIRYAERFGYGVAFPQSRYELWAVIRSVNTTGIQKPEAGNGSPIDIRRRIELRAAPGGTTFFRKAPDGSDPAVHANWVAAYPGFDDGFTSMPYYRGGMIHLAGQDSMPEDPDELASVVLRGKWTLDGGIPRSDDPGLKFATSHPDYTLTAAGKGWDIYDQGIKASNDKWAGMVEFDDLTVTGFRGELYYPTYLHGGIKGRRLELSQSDGNGFNPAHGWMTTALEVDHLYIHHVYQALEGSVGWKARIGTMDIADCTTGGNISPGTFPGTSPPASAANDDDYGPNGPGWTPSFTIGRLIVARTPAVLVGRNTFVGEAVFTDCYPQMAQGPLESWNGEIGSLTVTADRANVAYGVAINALSAVAGTKRSLGHRVRHLHLGRTRYALANGFAVGQAFAHAGSLGDDCFIDRITGYATSPGGASVTPIPDFCVGVGDLSGLKTFNATAWSHNVETSATIVYRGPQMLLTVTTPGYAGTYNLPSSPSGKLPKGAVLSIRNGSSAPLTVGTGWTVMTRRLVHLPGTTLTFRTNGSFWEPVDGRPMLMASTAAAVLSKGGTDIPAGDVSNELTFTVAGARPGMIVRVAPTATLSGDLLLVGRVVANDTVGIRARNLNLGASLSLPVTIYRVELDWAS